MTHLSFSKEPVLWIGFIIALLQVVQAVLIGDGFDVAALHVLLTALGAIVGRQLVSPVAAYDNSVRLAVLMNDLKKEEESE